jgi:hypothetical protein
MTLTTRLILPGQASIQVVFCPSSRTVVMADLDFLPHEPLLDAVWRALRQFRPKPTPFTGDPNQGLAGEEGSEALLNAFGWEDFNPQDPDKGCILVLARLISGALDKRQVFISVWGQPKALTHELQAGDRVELTRALRVDPKVARRERFQQQGAKAAGLFAKKRANAKAGY